MDELLAIRKRVFREPVTTRLVTGVLERQPDRDAWFTPEEAEVAGHGNLVVLFGRMYAPEAAGDDLDQRMFRGIGLEPVRWD